MSNSTDNTIGRLFLDISKLRIFCYNHLLKSIDVTASQASVLFILFEEEGVKQGDLARRLGIRAVTLGGIIDRMEAKGWLERRADAVDRRSKQIWLTREGKALQNKVLPALDEVNTIAFNGISDSKMDALVKTMRSIEANLIAYQQESE